MPTTLSRFALIASVCLLPGAPAAADDAPGTIAPYEFITHDDEVVEAERGSFSVPINRMAGSPDRIELVFVRFPSTNPEPGPPIVYLAGGPGGSGINAARSDRFPLFMALREVADVIAFDQRATGESSPLEHEECERTRPRPAGRPLDHATLEALELDAARECAAWWRELGIDLAAYNTIESADDLEALRRFLGAEKISLWSISYGTHLALATLRRYPDSIDRLILAGVEGPDHTVKLPEFSERQIDRLEELLAGDPEMARRYPDIRAAMRNVLDELERNPVTIEYRENEDDEPERVVVGRPDLERVTIWLLRDPSSLVAVPALYERIAAGDTSDLRDASTLEFDFEAMSEAMDAASGLSKKRARAFRRQAKETLLGGGDQWVNAGMNAALGVPDLGRTFRAPVRSDAPALFISGTLDGRTPVGNAEEVLKGFPNGAHLVIENAGHSDDLFLSSPRILEIMRGFLAGEPIASTRITVPPPPFDSVRARVTLPATTVRRYLGEYRRSEDDVWRVISTGLYRSLDTEGQVVGEDMEIEVRFGGNGYTLLPVSELTFYIPLPGIEQIDFTFVPDGDGGIARLEYINREGQRIQLPRLGS